MEGRVQPPLFPESITEDIGGNDFGSWGRCFHMSSYLAPAKLVISCGVQAGNLKQHHQYL